jgi:hypothetical protein
MAEGILHRFRARTRSVESVESEFEAWKEMRAEPMAVHDLKGWIVDTLELTTGARHLLAEAEQTGIPGGEDGPARFGEAGLFLLDALVGFLELVVLLVDEIRANGYAIEDEAALRRALVQIREERSRFVRRWPTNLDLWNRAMADIQAGRVHTLEEARDELRRRRANRNP